MRIICWFSKSLAIVFLFCWSLNSFAQICNEHVLPTTPSSRFELSGDEVQDLKTGLIWQRCSVGQDWDGFTCSGSATVHTWAEALMMADVKWRLPNIKELASIVEFACISPAINIKIFPNTFFDSRPGTGVGFWSSTPYSSAAQWFVNFYIGVDRRSWTDIRSGPKYVRLVRSGQ